MEKYILDTLDSDEVELNYILREPLLFGDYRNAISEDEPRYYEDLLDYEAIYHLFEVQLFPILQPAIYTFLVINFSTPILHLGSLITLVVRRFLSLVHYTSR